MSCRFYWLVTRPDGTKGPGDMTVEGKSSWPTPPAKVFRVALDHLGDEVMIDEYGRIYTGRQFLEWTGFWKKDDEKETT